MPSPDRPVFHTELVTGIGTAVDFNSSAYTNAALRVGRQQWGNRVADEIVLFTTAGTLNGHTLVRSDGSSEVVYTMASFPHAVSGLEFIATTGGDATVNFLLRWYAAPLTF